MDDKEPLGYRQTLIRRILMYLLQYPDAKDTVEGIKHWWLTGCEENLGIGEVEEAVSWLVAHGWISARESSTSKFIYGLNREKFNQIKNFLEKDA